MADHKYIRIEGTPGNYKYIYDVKNAFSGFGKGVAKAANTFGKNVASGTAQGFNNLRKDVKNAGSKLVMGTNGAVEKVKDVAEDVVDNVIDDTAIPAARALDKAVKNVKNATLKMIDDNKTVTKSGDEYARLYRDKRIGITNNIESVKGKKKDVRKFDKVYQTDFAAVRATANSDDAWRDMGRKGLEADKLRYDFDTKQQKHIMDDDMEKHDPEVMKKKYPYLAKNPGREYEAIFDTESKYPVSSPKALKKEFDDMMDAAEAYAKAKDHKARAERHEELASRVRDKAYDDYDKSGARKRIQLRAKAE